MSERANSYSRPHSPILLIQREAPKNGRTACMWSFTHQKHVMKEVKEARSKAPPSSTEVLIKSFRYWWRNPSGPPSDRHGKEQISFEISTGVTSKEKPLSLNGAGGIWSQDETEDVYLEEMLENFLAKESSKLAIWTAPLKLPSSSLAVTCSNVWMGSWEGMFLSEWWEASERDQTLNGSADLHVKLNLHFSLNSETARRKMKKAIPLHLKMKLHQGLHASVWQQNFVMNVVSFWGSSLINFEVQMNQIHYWK